VAAHFSKATIGAFVVGAIVLLVAGVLVLGAGTFFTKQTAFVTYFDGSVKGLNVGSPVTFRGVKVGSVTDISIIVDRTTNTLKIPVIFVLDPAKFKGIGPGLAQGDRKTMANAVSSFGLRTQLQPMNFVTGQLMLALDFFPDKPARYVGLVKAYPEIPSVSTPLEELQKTVQGLPLKEMVENLNKTIAGLDRIVSSVDAEGTNRSIKAAVQELQLLIRNVNSNVGPLSQSLATTSGAAQGALAETKETMVAMRGGINDVMASTRATLESAQSALKQSQQTLQSYGEDSELVAQVDRTLRDLSAMSRSFRQLADYLERHPEALLRGKGSEGGRDGR